MLEYIFGNCWILCRDKSFGYFLVTVQHLGSVFTVVCCPTFRVVQFKSRHPLCCAWIIVVGLCMYSVEIIKLLVLTHLYFLYSGTLWIILVLRLQLILWGLLILSLWRFLAGSCSSLVGCWEWSSMLDSRLNQHCVIGENFDPAAAKSIRFSLTHSCWLVERNPWEGNLRMIWPSRYLSLSKWRMW